MGKCCRDVLEKSVVEKSAGEDCCREVLKRSVVKECFETALWRRVL